MEETILLTNDDGPRSPFLLPFVERLRASSYCSKLHIVVPADEQSWIGQSVTRFRPLFASETTFSTVPGFLVSGTPADCVGLGLHSLFDEKASYVFSGINIGTNATLPFFLNSGTLGGAKQALTFGVRGIAFSALVPEEIFRRFREDDFSVAESYLEDFQRIAHVSLKLAEKLLHDPFWDQVDLYSFNIPWEATEKTEVVLSDLAELQYKSIYIAGTPQGTSSARRFIHHFQGFEPRSDALPRQRNDVPLDFDIVRSGKISLVPLRFQLGRTSAETQELLNSTFSD